MKRVIILSILGLSGCATSGTQVRNQMLSDLQGIVAQGDCPTACAMLKAYVNAKLQEGKK